MYCTEVWLTISKVNNTIPLQKHGVITKTRWSWKEWIFEPVTACHTNVPVCCVAGGPSSVVFVKQNMSILGACLVVCMICTLRNITDCYASCEWVVVFFILSLTFAGSCQVWDLRSVTTAVPSVCQSACMLSVLRVWGDAEGGVILSMAWSSVSQCFIHFAQLPSFHVIVSSRLSSRIHLWTIGNSLYLSLSLCWVHCSILDYTGRRMCMAELLGRAARI